MSRRRDLAVVLARGRSRRMGRAKGLVRMSDDSEPFVSRVCALYRDWAEVVVVVPQHEEPGYAEALRSLTGIQVLAAPGGEGTARTLCLGWRAAGAGATHLWAHPVDMPEVKPATVAMLRERSSLQPDRILRPVVAGRPGHPVVMPTGFVAQLAADPVLPAGDVRDALPAAGGSGPFALEEVPCSDGGAVKDFDSPGDLAPDREPEGRP